jgi:hypothetical protein
MSEKHRNKIRLSMYMLFVVLFGLNSKIFQCIIYTFDLIQSESTHRNENFN